jgi:GntR family transcriptional regulator
MEVRTLSAYPERVSIEPNDPRPPYQQVAADLRRRIQAGEEYAPGARLPSIRHLAKQYGISPQTVQNALRELRQEKLVVSQQGRAFFVRDPGRPIVTSSSMQDDDVRKRLAVLEDELRDLQDRVAATEQKPDLKEDVAALRVQVMNLYSRIGQPYPHESPAEAEPRREQTS